MRASSHGQSNLCCESINSLTIACCCSSPLSMLSLHMQHQVTWRLSYAAIHNHFPHRAVYATKGVQMARERLAVCRLALAVVQRMVARLGPQEVSALLADVANRVRGAAEPERCFFVSFLLIIAMSWMIIIVIIMVWLWRWCNGCGWHG
jgi:hypothetical protein